MSKEEFITIANKLYNNKFDYSKICMDKLEPFNNVPIICPKHGLFFQSVYDHLMGKDCFYCTKEYED